MFLDKKEQQKARAQLEELIRESGCKPFTEESFDEMIREFRADPLIMALCERLRECYEWERRMNENPEPCPREGCTGLLTYYTDGIRKTRCCGECNLEETEEGL